MKINISILNQQISTDTRRIVANSINFVTACCQFDSQWSSFSKQLIFTNGSISKAVIVSDDTDFVIPSEVLVPGSLEISAVGLGLSGEKRITTRKMLFPIAVCPSGMLSGDAPEDYTPKLWEQVSAQLGDLGNLTVDGDTIVDAINSAASDIVTDHSQLLNRSSENQHPISAISQLQAALDSKQPSEAGKGLSDSNYTAEEKSKLLGIEAGAQKNTQSDFSENNTSADGYIKNRPSRLSQFTDDLGAEPMHTHSQYIDNSSISMFAGALLGTIKGTNVSVGDVSAFNHELSITQYGQCVQTATPSAAAPAEISGKAAGITIGGSGTEAVTQTVCSSSGAGVTLYGIPVASDGNVVIGYQPYISDTLSNNTVTRHIACVDLGTLSWYYGTASGRMTSTALTQSIWRPADWNLIPHVMCTCFSPKTNKETTNKTAAGISVDSDGRLLVYDPDMGTDAEAFKASLSGKMLYYHSVQPYSENVTVSPASVSAYSPITTVLSAAYSEILYNRDLTSFSEETTKKVSNLCASYELIEEILVEDNISSLVRTEEPNGRAYAFQGFFIQISAAAGSAAAPLAGQIYFNGSSTSKWYWSIDNAINTTARYSSVELFDRRGRYVLSVSDAATSASSSAIMRVYPGHALYSSSDNIITRLNLLTSSGKTIPTGTEIKIYGVRA